MAAIRFARRVDSHNRHGPNPDRRHRCHDCDDGHQRSRMGDEQMGDRGPFCFVAAALSGQSHQWREDHWEGRLRTSNRATIALKMAATTLTAKQYVPGSAVPPTEN